MVNKELSQINTKIKDEENNKRNEIMKKMNINPMSLNTNSPEKLDAAKTQTLKALAASPLKIGQIVGAGKPLATSSIMK